MSALPFEAVLCDIDGVLRHWPDSGGLDRAHGFPPGTLAATAFAAPRLRPAITGEVTDEQWRAAVASDLTRAHGSAERAHALVAAWSAVVPRVDREAVALLARVSETMPLALVSNATTRLERDLVRDGLDALAHAVVNTSRIGVAKPAQGVYRLAAERLGVPPGRCLFVDDTAANADAARAAGMAAVHYRRVEDLREAVAPLLPNGRGRRRVSRDG